MAVILNGLIANMKRTIREVVLFCVGKARISIESGYTAICEGY